MLKRNIIYKATNVVNGNSYIGKTKKSLEQRRKEHLRFCKFFKISPRFYPALVKYGVDCFHWEILESNILNLELLNEREIYWISLLSPEYNIASGGEGGLHTPECIAKANLKRIGKKQSQATIKKRSDSLKGYKHTKETRENMSKAQSNRTYWPPRSKEASEKAAEKNRGKKRTPEAKQRISLSLKGKSVPVERRLRISKTLMGRKPSIETRIKIGNSNRGRTRSNEIRLKISQGGIGKKKKERTPNSYSLAQSKRFSDPQERRNAGVKNIGRKYPKKKTSIRKFITILKELQNQRI